MSQQDPNDHFEHPERPTVDRPIGAPADAAAKRSPVKPLLITVGLFLVLGILYYLGAEFLVNAD